MIRNLRSGTLVAVVFSAALLTGCDSNPNSRDAKITGTVPTEGTTQTRRESARGTGDSVKSANYNSSAGGGNSARRSH